MQISCMFLLRSPAVALISSSSASSDFVYSSMSSGAEEVPTRRSASPTPLLREALHARLQKLEARFEKETSELRAMLTALEPTGGIVERVVQHRQLQDGSQQLCRDDSEVLVSQGAISQVCCDQMGESCSSKLPTSCNTYDCSLIVQAVESSCYDWLNGDQTGLFLAGPLSTAASLCSAAPEDSGTTFIVHSDPTNTINSCSGTLRSQTQGEEGLSYNRVARIEAPEGWVVQLLFRAFNLGSGKCIKAAISHAHHSLLPALSLFVSRLTELSLSLCALFDV